MNKAETKNIILIRHPQSVANVDRLACKDIQDKDIDLSPEGILQKNSLIQFICNNYANEQNLIVTYSPFKRTKIPALEIIDRMGNKIESFEEEKISEMSFGSIKGLTNEEWQKNYSLNYIEYISKKKTPEILNFKYPNGESLQDAYNRCNVFLQEFIMKQNFSALAVISHEIPLKMLLLNLCKRPITDYFMLDDIPNASVRSVELKGNAVQDKGLIYTP